MRDEIPLISSIEEKYVIIKEVGRGSFAIVYKGYLKDSSKKENIVAIKSVTLRKLSKKLLESLQTEIAILKKLQHPHIVGLIDCVSTTDHVHLIMEYCSLGDLSGLIRKKAIPININRNDSQLLPVKGVWGGLREDIVRHFVIQLASALHFLRSRNLIHRDLKPQNLLLSPAKNISNDSLTSLLPVLHLGDFGFARFLPSQSMANTICGSPLYMAPEVLQCEKYDGKADLWSVGVIVYEMIYGKPPFKASNQFELIRRIQKLSDSGVRFPDDIAERRNINYDHFQSGKPIRKVPEELKDLIRKLLKKDQVERMSFEEFFMHPVIRDKSIIQSSGLLGKSKSDKSEEAGQFFFRKKSESEKSFKPVTFRSNLNQRYLSNPAMIQPQTLPTDLEYFRKPSLAQNIKVSNAQVVHDHKAAFQELGKLQRSSSLGNIKSLHNVVKGENNGFEDVTDISTLKPPSNLSDITKRAAETTGAFTKRRGFQQFDGRINEKDPTHIEDKTFQIPLSKVKPISGLVEDSKNIKKSETIDEITGSSGNEDDFIVIDKNSTSINAVPTPILSNQEKKVFTEDQSPSTSGSASLARAIISVTTKLFSRPAKAFPHHESLKSRNVGNLCLQSDSIDAQNEIENKLYNATTLIPLMSPFPSDVFPLCSWTDAINAVTSGILKSDTSNQFLVVICQNCPSQNAGSHEDWLLERLSVLWYPLFCYLQHGDQCLMGFIDPFEISNTFDEFSTYFPLSMASFPKLNFDFTNLNEEQYLKLQHSLSIYIKSLEMLQFGFELVNTFWNEQAARVANVKVNSLEGFDVGRASKRLSIAIRYWNELFNQTLEKAEFVSKLEQEVKKSFQNLSLVPEEDDTEHSSNQSMDRDDGASIQQIIYDRASALSRNAAVNEVIGIELHKAVRMYEVAMYMLEGLLLVFKRDQGNHLTPNHDRQPIPIALVEEHHSEVLSEEHVEIIGHLLTSIIQRAASLESKLEEKLNKL